MKDDRRMWVYLATALITLLLSACFDDGSKKLAGTADTAMLLDKDATPAPYALIRLQERPVFHMDDRKRPFAMIDDRKDKPGVSDKPLSIQESKP